MEQLEKSFIKTQDNNKITFNQIQCEDLCEGRRLYVYALHKNGANDPYAFEVFIPRLQLNDIEMPTNGYISKAGEKYPGNNDFGQRALYIGGVGTLSEKMQRVEDTKTELREAFFISRKREEVKKNNKAKKDAENVN